MVFKVNKALGLLFGIVIFGVCTIYTHGFTDVGQRDPQREDDGEEEEIREALSAALGPRQAQGLIFLLVFVTLFKEDEEDHMVMLYTHTRALAN